MPAESRCQGRILVNLRSSARGLFTILIVTTFLAAATYADTFEFLTYTPPPSGWTKLAANDGIVYTRASGIGLIYFYASHAATGSASDEFASMWGKRVGPTVPGPAPQPQLQRDGDYAVAVGSKRIDAKGTITTVALVTIVGGGRAIGVLTMSAGDDALREVTAFLDSVNVTPGLSATAAPNSGSAPVGGIEVDFDVPPGYVSQRDGRMVVLKPITIDRTTPCVYGVSPSRQSSGRLDADAGAAILEPLPGWQLKSDSYNAIRGTAGAGWSYHWIRTDVRRLVGGSYEYLTAMTMAFPASSGRVNIVWGFGSTGPCLLDDLHFARLFHSLRPRGWTSDGGRAFARDLHGTWRNSQNVGMAQYKFLPNGRYEFGIGTVTTMGLFERTSSSVSDGRYELRSAELTISPDVRGRSASRYRVRIYDEFVLGRWTRAMSLLDENAKPALEVQYMRVEDSR